ncbi:phage portal protein [Herpetosiphon llansteffanensis]
MKFVEAIKQRVAAIRKASKYLPHLHGIEHVFSSARTGDSLYEIDNYMEFAGIYNSYVWVRKAVNVIVESLAPLPVRVVDSNGKPLKSHPLNDLFGYINDTTTPSQHWQQYFIHLILGGENPVELVTNKAKTKVIEMWNRRPDRLWILPDYARLNYPRIAEFVFYGQDADPIRVPASHMVFDRFYNPRNVWRGITVLGALRTGVKLDVAGQRWNESIVTTGAKPEYAVTTKKFLTDGEKERLEQQIMDKHGTGRPLMLDDETTVVPYSWAPKDMEWVEQRRFARDEIGGLFGIPDEIMGYGKDTYDNLKMAERLLWRVTLKPYIGRRDSVYTKHFTYTMPLLNTGERIETDVSDVSALQQDDDALLERATKFFGMGVPFNTVDQSLSLGIGAIPGGDVGYLPSTLIPADEMSAPLPAPQTKGVEVLARAKKPSSARTGRALQRIRKQVAADMETAIEGYFEELANSVVARARANKFARFWHKAITKKAVPDLDVLITDDDVTKLGDIVGSFYLHICEASWETWNKALGLTVEFDADNAAVVAALDQAGEQVRMIDETTKTALQALLKYATEQGWTISQLIKGDENQPGIKALIQETYKNRARTIARTELGTAQNICTLARYKDAGIKEVEVFDNGQDDPDSACRIANGQKWSLKDAQKKLLEHPNCTRAFAPVESKG